MDWIRIEEKLPAVNEKIYLCNSEDPYLMVDDAFLIQLESRFYFDGPGWFSPLPISKYTHWTPRVIPNHVKS